VLQPSSPPTRPISLPGGRDAVEERFARGVLDLALRVGEAMLATGAPAADVTAAVLRLCAAFGVRSVQVDLTFTSLTLSLSRGEDDDPLTLMRVVQVRASDYTRLDGLQALVRDAAAGLLTLREARERLERLVSAPHPYRRWVVTAALGVLAASATALIGGGWAMLLISGLTTATIDRLLRWLSLRGLPAFFQQAVGAAVPTLVAMALLTLVEYTGLSPEQFRPSLVVAAGIIVLLAGLGLVGAAQDAIDGYYVTAGGRGYEVLLLTLGIVVGVLGVLDLASRVGVPLQIREVPTVDAPAVVQVAAAAAVAGAWAVAAYARPRAVAVSALGGAIAWVTLSTGLALGLGPGVSSAVAAGLVGVLAQAVAEPLRVPTLAIQMSGVVPLLPGLTLYRSMFEISQAQVSAGLGTLVAALSIGIGLASGVSAGTFLGRPLRSEMDRWNARALRRATAGRD
jgi:uncharacterized membrane protein YjjP (DUF1212 family)